MIPEDIFQKTFLKKVNTSANSIDIFAGTAMKRFYEKNRKWKFSALVTHNLMIGVKKHKYQ